MERPQYLSCPKDRIQTEGGGSKRNAGLFGPEEEEAARPAGQHQMEDPDFCEKSPYTGGHTGR